MSLRITNLSLPLDEEESALPGRIADRLGVGDAEIGRWRILRKSLDARRRDDIRFVYTAEVSLADPDREAALLGPDRAPYAPDSFDWPEPGESPMGHRPVIVGSGPAGLFAAYFLALSGYRPLVLERGRAVKDRVADVRGFDEGGPVDPESNYLFGEGGAGTFSDGKLTSRGTGPDVRRVLEVIADCHGKPSVVYEHRPHLGSNRLPLIVRTLRRKIEELGGEVRFSCRVEDLDLRDGRLQGLMTSSGHVPGDVAVLAAGHSARDVYQMLLRRGVPLEFKPFQFGVRIEQPQEEIDRARYGPSAGHPALGAADYELATRAGDRDLFTFCMCAGGYVMGSVSEPGYFCTNGMSESRHDSPFANSGLVVTIGRADVGSDHPLAGVHFQQQAERRAYLAAGRSYRAPIQSVRDLMAGRASVGSVPSSYPRGTVATDLGLIMPPVVMEALERGLPRLDRSFRGLFLKGATLTGPESRGSSPVRIPRDSTSRESPAVLGLYPCGEGAGYAGGIVSAAVDGLRTARSLVSRYARPGS
ncbi:NAD(P)/FAD-dependent oxidoreductase [Tautonia plasticadhaerens]|uniref:D-amino acid dehydrogenase small subunit n=1 Tax=Tautonia plasticadhaerens TaxID=2527974 RepID=A0A518H3K1_9BACT|nr:NAD(P)-binding protein [Tautonia plasticadhaerens]QDV35435.1 D-amino acid dehydrogenase small subunit [Tautonia plasticadhaerens]